VTEVTVASSDAEIIECFPLFKVLRPHLSETGSSVFLERVHSQQQGGYEVAYIRESGEIVSAAGYRELEFLAWGRVLYVDDLVTDPGRLGRGLAGTLMDWLISQARLRQCTELHLDTGYQRHAAHRLYLSKGLQLNCHHLALKL